MTNDLATRLRGIPTLTGASPSDLPATPPARPEEQFVAWLDEALAAGVPEPLAMTVSTVDDDGVPDARILILKDVDAAGWAFAGTRGSGKGRQIAHRPLAALSFWWQPVRRAVRVRGRVVEASAAESLADLEARPASARAGMDPADWVLWRVVPDRVEFWQGADDRRHRRLVYEPAGADWSSTLL
jgi:pyridoxamine 5'-phosphate oxidase